MTLLALLPVAPELGMLAAILAWRAVYYAAPALIGAALAVRGPRGITPQRADLASPAFLQRSHRAEVLIHAQGEHRALPMGAGGGWLTARSAHLLIGLFDPVGAATQPQISKCLQGLATAAQARNRIAVLYKCAARTAATARSLGFAVQPIAREAWLDPRRFRLAAAARSGLRRKLRHAQSAGVSVSGPSDPGPLPFAEMDRIAAHWAGAHGGERGYSMGRYACDYVAGQRVYLARRNGRLVGFVTFHAGVSEWVLDLMRHGADLPDGSMHLLIIRAIEDATRLDMPRLSLAAVPETALKGTRLRWLSRLSGIDGTGLARFKSAFAPHWQQLYLCAPNRAALVLAGIEISRAIATPPALSARAIEQDHEDYEFASVHGPWQRRGN